MYLSLIMTNILVDCNKAILMMTELLKVIFLAWLIIIISACSDEYPPKGRMPPVLGLGENAPDFDFIDLTVSNQQPKKLSLLKGKVIYLDFWASWCKPCLISMPLLNQLYAELKDSGFEIIAVNLDEKSEIANQFLLDNPVNYTVVRSIYEPITKLYQINGLPTAYIIDRQGVLRFVHQGFKKEDIDELRKQLILLLN